MSKTTKKECWDILEDQLNYISECRVEEHVGEAKLAVSVIISAGRDGDVEWAESNLFDFYCKLARLHTNPTRELILRTIAYLDGAGKANFKQPGSEE